MTGWSAWRLRQDPAWRHDGHGALQRAVSVHVRGALPGRFGGRDVTILESHNGSMSAFSRQSHLRRSGCEPNGCLAHAKGSDNRGPPAIKRGRVEPAAEAAGSIFEPADDRGAGAAAQDADRVDPGGGLGRRALQLVRGGLLHREEAFDGHDHLVVKMLEILASRFPHRRPLRRPDAARAGDRSSARRPHGSPRLRRGTRRR